MSEHHSDREFRQTIADSEVFLPELARETARLEGIRFFRCTVLGPAVVAPDDECSFIGPAFVLHPEFSTDTETLYWPVPRGRWSMGLIGLMECRFVLCRVETIGFAGGSHLRRWPEVLLAGGQLPDKTLGELKRDELGEET